MATVVVVTGVCAGSVVEVPVVTTGVKTPVPPGTPWVESTVVWSVAVVEEEGCVVADTVAVGVVVSCGAIVPSAQKAAGIKVKESKIASIPNGQTYLPRIFFMKSSPL